MDIQEKDPEIISISTILYRLLLFTYPIGFRRDYAPHMAQVFRDCCLRAWQSRGLPGMLSLWSLTLTDYIKSAFIEHTRKGVHMKTSRFIRLSGWALVLGGFAMLVGGLASELHSGQYPYNPNNYFSRPLDPLLEVLPDYLLPSAFLLLTIGMLGLYLRYSPEAGSLGRGGLVASIVGGSLGFTAILASLVAELDLLWSLLLASIFLLFGGIFLFGTDAQKRQILPRWNYLPLLTGIWFPIFILASQLYEALAGNWMDTPAVDIPMFLVSSLGLIGIGYLLQSDAPTKEELAMG